MAKFSKNAITVLKKRYNGKDKDGNPTETPDEMIDRVAKHIAMQETESFKWYKKFHGIMDDLKFLPNSPTLMNAGRELNQLSACFVLPVEDTMEGIFDAVKWGALVNKSGGGTGYSFSSLRAKDSSVGTTGGVASGPVSFMHVFDTATEQVKQGGTRRGANMGMLRVDHPDILEFMDCKKVDGVLSNFNISVAVTDDFMKALCDAEDYNLIDPISKKIVGSLNTQMVWDRLVTSAWDKGDPGIVFIDTINKHNQTPDVGELEATNPCGEQPLLPFEACNLGSINLAKFVIDNEFINYDDLERVTRIAVRFLDDVIDAGTYPLPQIDEMVKSNRKIGLGVMGFADMLYKIDVPYDSEEALNIARSVMGFIGDIANEESYMIAEEKGSFPNVSKSIYENLMRNATVTTIAPTGTLSILADCSSGIEPVFALSFVKNVMGGEKLLESNPIFVEVAKERGFYTPEIMEKIADHGSCVGVEGVPEDIQRVFVTAHDIAPEWHIKMQSAFQDYTDNAVSKTVNLPNDATIEDVDNIYRMAYNTNCKGVTIYRDGSKMNQVLTTNSTVRDQMDDFVSVFENHRDGDIVENVTLPDESIARCSILRSEGKKWYIFTTFKDVNHTKPFAIFVATNSSEKNVDTFSTLDVLSTLAIKSGLNEDMLKEVQRKYSTQSNPVKICRVLGFLFRHNVDLNKIIDALNTVDGATIGTFVHRLTKYLYQFATVQESTLSECPECGQNTLTFQEGCKLCNSCGYSACG